MIKRRSQPVRLLLSATLICASAHAAHAQGPPAQDAPPPRGTIRTIDVDGHAVRLISSGLDVAGAGPVVVFEGGSTSPIEGWYGVIRELPDDVPFLAYDPPGIAGSEWDGIEPMPDRVADRLRGVLRQAGAQPPFVVVGHSWETWPVRAFEGRYGDEVAGLVLIDPTPPAAEMKAAAADAGFGDAELAQLNRIFEGLFANAPEPLRARQRVIQQYEASGSDPDVPAVPSVPVVVLAAGRYNETELPEALRPDFDYLALFAAIRRRQTVGPIPWVNASPNGLLLYAAASPHCIQCTDPGLVAWAIQRLVELHAGSR